MSSEDHIVSQGTCRKERHAATLSTVSAVTPRDYRIPGETNSGSRCVKPRFGFFFARNNATSEYSRARLRPRSTGCAFRDEHKTPLGSSLNTQTVRAACLRGPRGAHPALAHRPGALTAIPARPVAAGRRAPCARCAAPGPLRRPRGNGSAGAGGPQGPGAWPLSARWP